MVLLDLKLPRKSGLEALDWMRKAPVLAQIPVFVLSASLERGDVGRDYALEANPYLVKQVDIRAIREIVRGIAEDVAIVAQLGASDAPQVKDSAPGKLPLPFPKLRG